MIIVRAKNPESPCFPRRFGFMKRRLGQLFKIQPGEGESLSLILGFSFFKGIAFVFFEAAASAIFLARHDARLLPYVYIVTAGINIVLGFGFTRLEARFSPGLVLGGALGMLTVAPVLGFLAIQYLPGDLPAILLLIWKDVLWVLGSLVLWAAAGFILNIRQSKRLYGLIGSGEILAIFLGGLAIPFLVKIVPTPYLFLVSAGGCALSLLVYLAIVRRHPDEFRGVVASAADQQAVRPRQLFQDRYILLFCGLSMISMIAFAFVDFIFFTQVAEAFPDEESLAGFFGYYLASLGILNLIGNGFVSARLLNRFGVSLGLLLLPVMLAAGDLTMLVVPALVGGGMLLWLTVGTKITDEVIRVSIETPSYRILYQPLPGSMRLPVQTIRESIVEPAAFGIAGVLILAFTALPNFRIEFLLIFLLVLIGVWIFFASRLGGEYSRRLIRAISGRGLSGQALAFEDASMKRILTRALESDEATQVIYALRMLAESGYEDLAGRLVELLNHANPRVQYQALQSLEDDPAALTAEEAEEAMRRIQALIEAADTDPAVRARALRTCCALGETDVLDDIAPFMKRRNPELLKNAIAGLLRYGGIDGVLVAGAEFLRLLESRSPARRKLAADILEDAAIPGFYRPLLRLLQDNDEEVRHHAIRAAAVLKNPKCSDAVMESLWDPRLAGAAEACLAGYGPVLVGRIEMAFALPRRFGRRREEKKGARVRRPDPERRINNDGGLHEFRSRLLRLLGRIGGPEGIAALTPKMNLRDVALQSEVLAALAACRYSIESESHRRWSRAGSEANENRANVESNISAQLAYALRILQVQREVRRLPYARALGHALEAELDQARTRVFHLLSFLYDPAAVLQAAVRYRQSAKARQAVALEALDNLLDRTMRTRVFPLLEDHPAAERLALLQKQLDSNAQTGPAAPLSGAAKTVGLENLLTVPAEELLPWTRACAAYAAGLSGDRRLAAALKTNLNHSNGIVRETSLWALHAVDPRGYAKHKKDYDPISSPALKKLFNRRKSRKKGAGMLLTLEKALILKSVPIFEQVPEEPLAVLAGAVKEEEVKKGRTFIRKGEIGTSLFVIVEGSVRVHDGKREIAVVGKGEVVGELSALDPEPRTASVTALEDTLLFRIDDEEIYDFMTDNREVARGVIRVLVRRQRELVGRRKAEL